MTKTAEQFDAELDAITKRLVESLRPAFKTFYGEINAFGEELKVSDVPDHLKVAIMQRGLNVLEPAIGAIMAEIETEPTT